MPPTTAPLPSGYRSRVERRHRRPVLARERRANYDANGDDNNNNNDREANAQDNAGEANVGDAEVPHADAGPEVVPPALARLAEVPVPDEPGFCRSDDPTHNDPAQDDHPFGLPVLSEVPALATVLVDLRRIDQLICDVIDGLLTLEDSGLAEAVTGLGVDDWLTIVGRRTGADARMLKTSAATMRRIPSLHAAFRAGTVSWAQVRSVVLAAHRLPPRFDDRIDAAVAYALDGATEIEPDALTRSIRWHLAAIDPGPDTRDERQADQDGFLAMQPRLDGTGGRFWGEAGPKDWAVLDAALNAGAFAAGGDDSPGAETTDDDDTLQSGPPRVRAAGRSRLRRLIGRLEHSLSDTGTPGAAEDPGSPTTASGPMRSRPQLLVRADLPTLLNHDQTPGWLLTTLLGGHVRVSADTARRLIDERGADLRTVIIDDTGAVVGVGRRTRLAPGWLSDATLALHDTCTYPGCQVAARRCDTDHASPWHPARADDARGRTDIDQLAPGCAHHNRRKEKDGWVVTQRPDGTRRWHHPRTGLTTRTLPTPTHPPPT